MKHKNKLTSAFRHRDNKYCGIIILAVSSRGVIQTLVWHQYYYSAVSARGVIQTLAWHPVFIISMSDRTG